MLQQMLNLLPQLSHRKHYPCSPCFPLGTSSSAVPFPSCPDCLSNPSNYANFFTEVTAFRPKTKPSLLSRLSSPPLSSSKSLSSMASCGDAALRRIILNNSGNSGVFLINLATL